MSREKSQFNHRVLGSIQFMPDGPNENDLRALLKRTADSLSEEDAKTVVDLSLQNTRVKDEKIGIGLYREADEGVSQKELMSSVTLSLSKGESQSDLPALLELAAKQIRSLGEVEVYSISLDDDMNELGSLYVLTIYYEKA